MQALYIKVHASIFRLIFLKLFSHVKLASSEEVANN